jgi:DNA invertase Pin-like site-specific DNA recombinase
LSSSEGSLLSRVRELRARREALAKEAEEATRQLGEAARQLVAIGVPESRVAREAGVSRQTLRVWTGKESWDQWRGKRGE